MSPELARHLVRPMIEKHPLPWRLEFDWTVEVTDSKDRIVIKLPSVDLATELITFAQELAAYDAQGAEEVRKLMRESGLEDDGG